MSKKIYFDCPVRKATPEIMEMLEFYVKVLENTGNQVHFPPRDTDQTLSGIEICRENTCAIFEADEVHVFYVPDSQGIHFDLGVAFAYQKPVFLVYPQSELVSDPKSFLGMIKDWMECGAWEE